MAEEDKVEAKTEDTANAQAEPAKQSAPAQKPASPEMSQTDIDEFFDYKDVEADVEEEQYHGFKAILDSAMVSYERLPMLEIVFDRLIRSMVSSFRNFTQDNVEVSLDAIESMRFGEYLENLSMPTLLSVFQADEWDNYGIISVDSALVYSMVDVLLGGRRGTAAMRIEGRPYTTIELNLIKDMIQLLLMDLSTAFDPITSVNFSFDRLETNPRFATISRMSNAVIVAKIRIDMEDRGGKIELMIPYATLEPIRELLLQMFMGERFGRDLIWENHLVAELCETEMELEAVLRTKHVSLGEVSKWEKGSFLNLDMSASDDVNVICGDIPLFSAEIGRKSDNIVVKLKGRVEDNG